MPVLEDVLNRWYAAKERAKNLSLMAASGFRDPAQNALQYGLNAGASASSLGNEQ